MRRRAWRRLAQRLGLGLAAFSALLFAPPLEDAYSLPQAWGLGLAALLLGLGAPPRLPLGPLAWLLPGFLAWRLFSHAVAQPATPALDWLAGQAPFWGLAFFAPAALARPAQRRYAAAALLAAAGLASALALLDLAGWAPWGRSSVDLGFSHRAHGSLGNPDFLGGWLAMLLPLGLATLGAAQGRARAALGLALALMLAALALTQARASWLAGLVGLLLAWRALRPQAFTRSRVLLGMGLALMVLAAGLAWRSSLAPRLAEALDPGADAWRSRGFMAGTALRIARQHPWVGVGAGGFTDAYLSEQGRRLSAGEDQPYRYTHDAHNDWVQLAAESGWLGLALFAWLWAWALRTAWRHGGPAGAAVAGGLAAFAVQACFHFPLAILPNAAALWMGLAAAAAWQAPRRLTLAPARRWALGLLLLVPALFWLGRLGLASALLNSGTAASQSAAHQALAAPLHAKAADLRPGDARAWLRLGAERLRLGRHEQAVEAFDAARQAHPGLPEAWVNLGLALGSQGALEAAELAAGQGVRLNPRSPEAWINWSKVAWLRGDAAQAEARLRQGLRSARPTATALFNLGAILYDAGRLAEAAEAFARTLELDPGHAEARRLLAESRRAR